MKRVGLFVAMLALVFSSLAIAADGVTWRTLVEGLARAKVEQKPMLVDFFFGKGCPRCENLEKGPYRDPVIAKKIMDDFIPVRIDLTKKELTQEERELGEKNNYRKDCLLLFLDPQGQVIKDPGGKALSCATMIDTEKLVHYLDAAKASMVNKDKH